MIKFVQVLRVSIPIQQGGVMKMRLITQVSGSINGKSYRASGTGHWNGDFTDTNTFFDSELKDFAVMYGKSWQCNNHPSLAEIDIGKPNPLGEVLNLGETIHVNGVANFPTYHGKLEIFATIKRKDGVQYVSQERNGFFSGPTDVVKQFDYEHEFFPAGNGVLKTESTEYVGLTDGTRVPVEYTWEFKIPSYFDIEPFKVSYHIRHSSFANRQFRISIAPRAFSMSPAALI